MVGSVQYDYRRTQGYGRSESFHYSSEVAQVWVVREVIYVRVKILKPQLACTPAHEVSDVTTARVTTDKVGNGDYLGIACGQLFQPMSNEC